ncbi:hypothetical protein VCHENC02_1507B, partial [Vibrio harveyi]
SAIV